MQLPKFPMPLEVAVDPGDTDVATQRPRLSLPNLKRRQMLSSISGAVARNVLPRLDDN